MTDIDKLKEEEIAQLDGELNLEDLLILGDAKKIPIKIKFPLEDGTTVEAKALVKQLTVKELENLKLKQNTVWKYSVAILEKALFKQDGTPFNSKEIRSLPLGVANAIASKVMELSGVEISNQTPMGQNLMDF
jgi:hypothetical protein